MDDIYKNIEAYNPNNKRNILIVFDYMIAYIPTNKTFQPIVTGLLLSLSHNLILKYQNKFNTLFCYEHYKQKRASTNFI